MTANAARTSSAAGSVSATRRRRRDALRRVAWRGVQRAHRWVALLTGALLLVIVLSGVVLVLDPEIHRALHADLYRATPSERPVAPEQALAVVAREHPELEAMHVVRNRGVYEVFANGGPRAHVDPSSGRLLGLSEPNRGLMGLMKNLHMCLLTCEEYTGHVGLLATRVSVLGNDLAVGTLVLGLSGLVLLALCVSGIVLWWPGLRRLTRGLAVRRKSRYATTYDLHKLAGMAAMPFLLLWAVTGAGFEFKQVEQAWYALLPGSAPPEPAFTSKPRPGREVTPARARQIAQAAAPGARLVSVSLPDRAEKTSAYSVWLARGNDPYDHGPWAGNVQVAVDRYSGRSQVTFGDHSQPRPLSGVLWEEWNFPLHAGTPVNGWWRIAWIAFGLAPLVLAVTGVMTWLTRRRKRRRKQPATATVRARRSRWPSRRRRTAA